MDDSFYISFTSDDSKFIFPRNKPTHFRFKLDKPLIFEGGKWTVTLVNFFHPDFSPDVTEMILCLNGIAQSILGDNKTLPMLQRYPLSTEQPSSLHIPVMQNYFDSLEIFIIANRKHLNSLKRGKSLCTLHFKRNHG